MKKVAGFIILVIGLFACSKNKNDFEVNGIITNGNKQKIFLSELTINNIIDRDSAILKADGSFILSGNTLYPTFYIVKIDQNNYITLAVKPGDMITIKSDASGLSKNYFISGSEESELIKNLIDKINSSIVQIDSLGNIYQNNLNSPDIISIKNSLDSTYLVIRDNIRNYTLSFIESNPGSLAALMALYAQITPREKILNAKTDFNYYKKVDSILSLKYPESNPVKLLHQQIQELEQQINLEKLSSERLGIGSVAPEIALPTAEGKIIALSSLRGKYVLLDFWASWCKPCREENPNLIAAYFKYKDKGFEIYQVSLDKTKEAWVKAIEDDKLTWINVSDVSFWNSPVVSLYNIQAIPYNFLLDKEGRIIATNLRGDLLLQKLDEIVK